MNRHRKTNRGLPRRVYLKSGAYRFLAPAPILVPKTGKMQRWVHLAYEHEGESAMLAALSALLGAKTAIEGSMPHACAEFKAHKLGRYSPEVRAQYGSYLNVVADEFEEFHAAQVTTKECAGFLRDKFKGKANTAKKYAALMRKLFKFVISELGIRQDNPIDQLDMSDYETRRREVLATHAQVKAIRAAGMMSKPRSDTGLSIPTASGPMFACIIDMSYLLWARAIDIRTLKEEQIENGRIRIKPSKTSKTSGKVVDITVTPSIQTVIDEARAIKRRYEIISPYLFPTQKGTPYAKSGLLSMWDRAKERIGMEDDVVFKDIRALGATDAARRGEDRKHIQHRLAHTSGDTTDIYIKEAIPDVSSIDMDLPWK
ncbi:tyrosine-type recombinase/integrase [Janthinobacterium sp.]|uniref:tyrosine-type recombinase/integrase n=1 Tax=Janthinobacterium sp. TaxID=1871054 RepID=UPI00293D977C|nr:tyrosine-type recombinase/integrase [Janthinobacterium sp.]